MGRGSSRMQRMNTDQRGRNQIIVVILCGLCVFVVNSALPYSPQSRKDHKESGGNPAPVERLSAQDEAFLEDLSRRSFRYFWEQANPHTGLVRDRARTDGSPHDE